ncbi:hypothetical protein [Streptomyces rubiginosohelvolus]|uniref:hypothetical protein n=1 Tax=Streptomyces rubiginosohelvolus TaxID=67362 RepID=UPI00379C223E
MTTSSPLPYVPPGLNEPTEKDASATTVRLVRALRGCGVLLEQVVPEVVSGRFVVAVHGRMSLGTAQRLAAGLESLAHRPTKPLEELRPEGTLPLEVTPDGVKVGDHLPLDGGCYRIRNMRGASGSSRILELEGRRLPWIMTGPRTVFRPADQFQFPLPT